MAGRDRGHTGLLAGPERSNCYTASRETHSLKQEVFPEKTRLCPALGQTSLTLAGAPGEAYRPTWEGARSPGKGASPPTAEDKCPGGPALFCRVGHGLGSPRIAIGTLCVGGTELGRGFCPASGGWGQAESPGQVGQEGLAPTTLPCPGSPASS